MLKKKPTLTREQSLDARPVRIADASLDRTDAGAALKVKLQPPRWGRWLIKYPAGATKTFELDSVGVFVWDACDGTTSVRAIIRRLAERYKLNIREAEVSSLAFLQTLARKGLIGMQVDEGK